MPPAKKATPAAAAEAPAEVEAPKLGRAGESGDPTVHWLLAERNTHASNGDVDRVAAIDAQLADLGLTAQ